MPVALMNGTIKTNRENKLLKILEKLCGQSFQKTVKEKKKKMKYILFFDKTISLSSIKECEWN